MTHGSLFSGIGNLDAGFERAGIQTLWQVESNNWRREILAMRFPSTVHCSDVCEFKCSLPQVDIISGDPPSPLLSQFRRIVNTYWPGNVVLAAVPQIDLGAVLLWLRSLHYKTDWKPLGNRTWVVGSRFGRIYLPIASGGSATAITRLPQLPENLKNERHILAAIGDAVAEEQAEWIGRQITTSLQLEERKTVNA